MISFVVPAYNEERCIGASLDAIHAAAMALGLDYEIVVADDASTDTTPALAQRCGARVVSVDNRQISKTRNDGARAAAGDRLIFVDADTRVNPAVVAAAVAALNAGAVGGGAAARFDADAPPWTHRLMAAAVVVMRSLRFAAGCFFFCTRDAFDSVGGFDERHFAAEEIVLSLALRRRGRFVILREAVTTSARKFVDRGPWQTLWISVRQVALGLRGVRRRDTTQFWYDGKR